MKSLTGITFAAAAAAALLAAHPAAAQLGGTKSDAPIDITADELEVQQGQCVSVWKGSAEALQDTSRLRADVLRAFFVPKPKAAGATAGAAAGPSNSACGELLRIEAEGSVYYVTPDQRVHSKAATYDANNSTVVMTGDVVAVHGQDVLRGDRMVFNNKTGEGHMEGGSKGGKDRPRGVFYPKQSTDQPAAAKPAAPKAGASR